MGKLFDDISFMGDTKCAQQILDGTYEYPLDTNVWTKKILQEAEYTFSQMSWVEIATTLTTEDFLFYWGQVDEQTLLSFSGIIFSHYKVAAFHPMLFGNVCCIPDSMCKERQTSG